MMRYVDFLETRADQCPFCDIPEDDILKEHGSAYLTYALAPYHKDHLLICPTAHKTQLLDLSQDELHDISILQQRGIAALQRLGYESITLVAREGEDNSKSIDHIHYHLIPATIMHPATHLGIEREILSDDAVKQLRERIQRVL